jgi:hypothetical protein
MMLSYLGLKAGCHTPPSATLPTYSTAATQGRHGLRAACTGPQQR